MLCGHSQVAIICSYYEHRCLLRASRTTPTASACRACCACRSMQASRAQQAISRKLMMVAAGCRLEGATIVLPPM